MDDYSMEWILILIKMFFWKVLVKFAKACPKDQWVEIDGAGRFNLQSRVFPSKFVSMAIRGTFFNSLRAKSFGGNINMYLHFMSFLHTDIP